MTSTIQVTNDVTCYYVKNMVDNERICIGNHHEVTAEDDNDRNRSCVTSQKPDSQSRPLELN